MIAARLNPPRLTTTTNASTWSSSTGMTITDGSPRIYALDTCAEARLAFEQHRGDMGGDDVLASKILRYGAYLCARPLDDTGMRSIAAVSIPGLAQSLEFENEFELSGAPPRRSIAFLRRRIATPGDIADEGVHEARWVVHVAAETEEPVASFCREAEGLLKPYAEVRTLGGVIRPRNYTGAAMRKWAYERAVVPQSGAAMPNAFLIPMSKTAEWWRKDWMERHTYFLPRYDDEGRMTSEGHALAAEAGVPCILRRTYHAREVPAPPGSYDFLTYFECADADLPLFAKIRANLRDVNRNPEWRFVREGPTWQGRRAPTWTDLFIG